MNTMYVEARGLTRVPSVQRLVRLLKYVVKQSDDGFELEARFTDFMTAVFLLKRGRINHRIQILADPVEFDWTLSLTHVDPDEEIYEPWIVEMASMIEALVLRSMTFHFDGMADQTLVAVHLPTNREASRWQISPPDPNGRNLTYLGYVVERAVSGTTDLVIQSPGLEITTIDLVPVHKPWSDVLDSSVVVVENQLRLPRMFIFETTAQAYAPVHFQVAITETFLEIGSTLLQDQFKLIAVKPVHRASI